MKMTIDTARKASYYSLKQSKAQTNKWNKAKLANTQDTDTNDTNNKKQLKHET